MAKKLEKVAINSPVRHVHRSYTAYVALAAAVQVVINDY
jgi:hypothetical protein